MAEAGATARLFFALWPDGALQARLAAWVKAAAGRGRPTRRKNIHLTLAFLGNTETALVPDLIALAREQAVVSFELPLDRVGYWKHNRIIWCGAERDPPALAALVEGLRARLDAAGVAYDHQSFVSHVTLVRNAAGLEAAPAWIPLKWAVADFALVASVRIEGRVTYQVLQRFAATAGRSTA